MRQLLGAFIIGLLAQCAFAQTSPHGAIKWTCESCHITDSWKMRSDASFQHAKTGFLLEGQHATVQCASCHTGLKFTGSSRLCTTCHTDVHKSELGANCTRCHSMQSWDISDMIQRHQTTRFPLLGRHATLNCEDCHVNVAEHKYTGTAITCFGCHSSDYQNTKNPNHAFAGFGTDCEKCHKVNSFAWGSNFDHNSTTFPLTGMHATTPCSACHVNGAFKNTAQDCYSCHQASFQATSSPNHAAAKFQTNCVTCHTTSGWSPASFSHDNTKFPLTGAHKAVLCKDCHVNNQFATLSMNCVDCHRTDFVNTTNPNHQTLGYPQTCVQCHSTIAWRPAAFDHNATKFALTGKHLTLQCQDCHTNNNFQLVYTNCYPCHTTDYARPTNPNHVVGMLDHRCESCHSTNTWVPSTFSHNNTKFPLTGTHVTTPCQSCHINGNYQLVYTDCYTCHSADFAVPTNPNHVTSGISHACETCHSTTVWKPSTFNHGTTKFALTGTHLTTPCQACHTNGNYQLVYTDCYPCHSSDYARPTNPNHVTGMLDHRCETCHSTTTWTPSTFNHSSTRFALTGTHLTTPCQSCHVNANYKLVYTDCYTCHSADFAVPTNPNHVTANFSHACETCHTTTVWKPSTFNHSTTKFPLTGTHVTTPCQSCHTNGNYQLAYTDCYACHSADFAVPTNPNHVASAFSHACETCHTTTVWKPSTFNHSTTKFALTGTHVTTPCQSCHVNGNYQLVYSSCYQCHATDFAGATNPNHVAGNFSQNCQTCHSTTAWQPSTFNHSSTKFALTGTHVTTPCQSCHTNGNYQLVYTDCHPCHTADYARPTNPNHVTGMLDHRCESCHSTTAWLPSTFNHSSTKFALTGVHVTTPCQSCHTNGNYQLVYSSCYQCHATDFAGATNPNHVAGNFSQNCQTCHSTTVWQPSTFNHSSTKFALTGVHVTTPCQSCHVNGNYQLVYSSCYQCHVTDFAGATNPNHVVGNFSQNCQTCHTTTAWQPATFDHSTTKLPLTGAHVAVPCQTCHTNGNYQLVFSSCYQCHSSDFAGTTNPNHVAGNFSQNCQTCHSTTAWQPATFDHSTTKFPLTGAHTSVTCQTCHTNGNYQLVYSSCYQCHATDYNGTTNPVHSTAGFPTTCQTCHTTSTWAGAVFNHTWFPQTHGNSGGVCAKCHTNATNYAVFSCTTAPCHPQAQTDSSHRGRAGYVYNSANCYSCHPRGSGG